MKPTLTALELNTESSKRNKQIHRKKNIITNIYRIQAYNLIMSRYFFIELIDFMLNGKRLLDYTNLFSLKEYEKNGHN